MKLIVVLGATATGKSDLALELAQENQSEIINFDSVQVYKKINIGTAKPSKEMLQKARHHLIDFLDLDQNFSAGDFRREALKILQDLEKKKHKVCVLVGGTGFYLKALLHGMHQVPQVSEEIKNAVREDLKMKGSEALFSKLQQADAAYAQKIHPNDTYRLQRALELIRSGVKASEVHEKFKAEKFPYEYEQIGLRRKKDVLKKAIEMRTQKMLDDGLIDEVKELLKKYPPHTRALQTVGYKETIQHINSEITLEELKSKIIQNTLQLAKRQSTWFKRDPTIEWFDHDEGLQTLFLKS